MDLTDLIPGGNAGDLKGILDLLNNNKDLLAKLDQLPGLFRGLADDLQQAGGEAHGASVALVGEGGDGGAKSTLGKAAEALRSLGGNVDKGGNLITDAGNLADKVPMMDGPASKLKETGQSLTASKDDLEKLASALDSTSEILAKVAEALGRVGDKLQDSSGTLHKFVD